MGNNLLILLVEDEVSLQEMLTYNLQAKGYEVAIAQDGLEALQAIESKTPDLILLDWMMPKLDGPQFCQILRNKPDGGDIPVIMLTAKGAQADKLAGFKAGVDDYVVKPFHIEELLARIQAQLRKKPESKPSPKHKEIIMIDALSLDPNSHIVRFHGEKLHLGPKEYQILQLLLTQPNIVFSRSRLLDEAWGEDVYVEERTVDVHIRRLRRTLIEAAKTAKQEFHDPIRTIRGVGYALDCDE